MFSPYESNCSYTVGRDLWAVPGLGHGGDLLPALTPPFPQRYEATLFIQGVCLWTAEVSGS